MEWISVKDAVPYVNEDVLVWNGSLNTCQLTHRLDEFYPECPELHNRYVWSEQGVFNEIKFWMPLPSPPKE